MGLFKTYQISGIQLTDSNTAFIHAILGSDSNLGTRNSPVATYEKATTLGKTYYLINGILTANSVNVKDVIFDSSTSGFSGNISISAGQNYSIRYGNSNIINGAAFNRDLEYLSIKTLNITSTGNGCAPVNCFINLWRNTTATGYANKSNNNTIIDFENIITQSTISTNQNHGIFNSIIVNSVNLYNFISRSNTTFIPIFKYCLFRKQTVWKWNSSIIPINYGSYGNTPGDYMADVISGLFAYANTMSAGTDKTYFLAMIPSSNSSNIFYANTNGQTNKVVDDVLYPIFNKYNGTTPIDYSLKLAANNVALTMSDIGSYVGAYKANLNHVQFGDILHVNADGSDDTVTTPDLLISEGLNQFSASDTSLQLRNRIRTTVLEFPRGKAFDGAQSMLTSGIASRLYFGKYQPMVTTGANPTIPVETIEVIPYDAIPVDNSVAQANNLSGKSAFPRFSIMFNGAAEMWYKNNAPLLFSQLANLYTGNGTISNTAGSNTVTGINTLFTTYLVPGDLITVGGQTVKVQSIASATSLTVDTPITNANTNAAYTVGIYVDKSLTEYGDWAVTNADIEEYSLSFKTAVAGVSKRKIPVKYCKLELNLNYAEE